MKKRIFFTFLLLLGLSFNLFSQDGVRFETSDHSRSLKAYEYNEPGLGVVTYQHFIVTDKHRKHLHDGDMFGITAETELASAATIGIIFNSPSSTEGRSHVLYDITGSGEGGFTVSQTTQLTAGAELTVYNLDWNDSTHTTEATVFYSDTVSDIGIVRPPGYRGFGSGQKAGGQSLAEEEFLINEELTALFFFTSDANNNKIRINITWHAGEDTP